MYSQKWLEIKQNHQRVTQNHIKSDTKLISPRLKSTQSGRQSAVGGGARDQGTSARGQSLGDLKCLSWEQIEKIVRWCSTGREDHHHHHQHYTHHPQNMTVTVPRRIEIENGHGVRKASIWTVNSNSARLAGGRRHGQAKALKVRRPWGQKALTSLEPSTCTSKRSRPRVSQRTPQDRRPLVLPSQNRLDAHDRLALELECQMTPPNN